VESAKEIERLQLAAELDHRVAERTRELAAANEELKRSEARKDAILSSALDCIVTIDHESRITEFNPAAERTFGYRRDAVLGRPLAEVIIPPSFRDQHHRGFARYLATGDARVLGRRIEMLAMRADGSEFPVELAITRIPMEGPPSFTGYLRDITERKRSEENLRRSEASLLEAQRLSSTGTFSWLVATGEIGWSEQTYRIFELDPAEPATLDLIGSRLHPEDIPSFQQMLDRQRDEGDDFEHEHRLLLPDHSVKYLHVVAHATRDQEGQLKYIGWVQDVTERRVAEAALGKARADLAHVARVTSLGALTASIAHEVNQPLSGIITNAGTCLRMLAADPPNVDGASETARRMIRDGHRATEVITRLRALFSRQKAELEAVDLNEAAQEVVALSLTDLQRNRVVLRSDLADDLPSRHGRPGPAPAGHPEPGAERVRRDERGHGPAARAGHPYGTGRGRRGAPEHPGRRSRPGTPGDGPALRALLHDQTRWHGDRIVGEPVHHREPQRPPMGGAERWPGCHVRVFHPRRGRDGVLTALPTDTKV
jgi:PAS domain S-box-containing protein